MPEEKSIVQKPREVFNIASLSLESEFERFLDQPVTSALEAFTGAFALGAKHSGVAAGRMAQAILKGQMYFQSEVCTLRKGRIPRENAGFCGIGGPT